MVACNETLRFGYTKASGKKKCCYEVFSLPCIENFTNIGLCYKESIYFYACSVPVFSEVGYFYIRHIFDFFLGVLM